LPAKPACEAETYSKLGEGDIAGKNDIFDISFVIEAPLTLILSPRFAGGEERKGQRVCASLPLPPPARRGA
jgi:hypothetical protein